MKSSLVTEAKMRLLGGWVDTLNERQKKALITALVIGLAEVENVTIDDIVELSITYLENLEDVQNEI